jgi:transposase-like protein
MNLKTIAQQFSTVEAARDFLEKQRWPEGPVCPHCGVVDASYRLTARPGSKSPVRPGVWKCRGCCKQYTVTKGTVFEDSHIPLNIWLMTIHLVCSSKKGVSAHQIHRMLGISYKAAWFMVHRLRYAATQDPLAPQLTGIVEVDETYIGGKWRRRKQLALKAKNGERQQDRPAPIDNKFAVVSMVQRNGEVRSHHVQRVTAKTLRPILYHDIEYGARVMTDSGTVLHGAIHPRKHDQVNHTEHEYGRYEGGICISTNTVEGFFSLLKRGINGTFHHVSEQHLHHYLSEFDFRYNHRKITDGERTCKLIGKVAGKRLMYKDLIPAKPEAAPQA